MSTRSVAFILLFSISIVLAFNNINNHHRILSRHKNLRIPPQISKRQDSNAQIFVQKLDHFDSSDTRTFNQRYFVNEVNWKTNGPIFLYVGGEISMSNTDVIGTQFANYASANGAVLIALEHRFFGESQPFSDLSTANLRYLTVEQALEDAANFIKGYKQLKGIGNVPVVAFGASYGGNLAVWLRQSHPEVFSSALGSSAPVQLTHDFSEYLVSVTTSINNIMGSSDCTARIHDAVVAMEELMKNTDNWATIATQFNGCGGNFNQELDTRTFMGALMELWQTAIQYNDLNKIRNYCSVMTNGGDPLSNLASVNRAELESDGNSCLNAFYSSYINFYGSIIITPGDGVVGYRQYFYLQCTQLGFFQTTSAAYPQQPFGTLVTPDLYRSECNDVFGIGHDPASDALNQRFGGKNPKTSQVIFSNGDLDPWSVLSVTSNIGNDVIAVIVPGAGHCADIYAYYGQNEIIPSQTKMGSQLNSWVSSFEQPVGETSAQPSPVPASSLTAAPVISATSESSVAQGSSSVTRVETSSPASTTNRSKGASVPVPSNAPASSQSLSTSEDQDSSASVTKGFLFGIVVIILVLG